MCCITESHILRSLEISGEGIEAILLILVLPCSFVESRLPLVRICFVLATQEFGLMIGLTIVAINSIV